MVRLITAMLRVGLVYVLVFFVCLAMSVAMAGIVT